MYWYNINDLLTCTNSAVDQFSVSFNEKSTYQKSKMNHSYETWVSLSKRISVVGLPFKYCIHVFVVSMAQWHFIVSTGLLRKMTVYCMKHEAIIVNTNVVGETKTFFDLAETVICAQRPVNYIRTLRPFTRKWDRYMVTTTVLETRLKDH